MCARVPCDSPLKELSFDGDELRIPVPDDLALHLEFLSPQCWLSAASVTADVAEVVVRRWPLATIQGQFDVEPRRDDVALFAQVRIAEPDPVETRQPCEVEGTNWKCRVPATRFSVKLEVPGLAPRHFRNVVARTEASTNLGKVDFHPGGTISGAVTHHPQFDLRDAFAELYQDSFGREQPLVRTPLSGGHFEFSGVAPGTYRVIARAKDASPTRSARVTVVAGSSHDAGELALQALATLKTVVTPATDGLQRPWRVKLERLEERTNRTTPVAEEALDPAGWWERSGLEAGAYILSVADVAGAKVYSDRVDVAAGMPLLPIELQLVSIRGSVALGSEPTSAEVIFLSTGLASGKRITMKSDAEGVFGGILPHEGRWNLRIRWLDRHTYVNHGPVDVKRRSDAAYAEVAVRLPAGKIEGQVVDTDGEPVVEADVLVIRGDAPAGVSSPDAEGRFEFLGLEEGAVMLRAMTRNGDSGMVPAIAAESFDTPVAVIVREERRIAGTLSTSDGRGIAGAALRFAAASSGIQPDLVSGPGGTFDLRVPHDTKEMTVTILAVGLPVSLQSMNVTGHAQPRLTVGKNGGELVIPMTAKSRQPLIGPHGGIPVPIRKLVFPPDGSPERRGLDANGFRIQMEPGAYVYCARPGDCKPVVIHAGQQTVVSPYEEE